MRTKPLKCQIWFKCNKPSGLNNTPLLLIWNRVKAQNWHLSYWMFNNQSPHPYSMTSISNKCWYVIRNAICLHYMSLTHESLCKPTSSGDIWDTSIENTIGLLWCDNYIFSIKCRNSKLLVFWTISRG